jgi:hypothetical protein
MDFKKFMDYVDDFLDIIKRPIYIWFVLLPYVVYLVSVFGLIYLNPTYIDLLKSSMQIFIALILLIRFNPLRGHHQLREYDETIIFGSALILLTNASLTNSFISYLISKI